MLRVFLLCLFLCFPAYGHRSCKRLIAHPPLDVPVATVSQIQDSVVLVIIRNGKILMGKRQGGAGAGTWGFVGGKVDPGESLRAAIEREANEEVGVKVKSLRWLQTSFDYREENGILYRVFFLTGDIEGDPMIREPEKMSALGWFSPESIPSPIFPSNQAILDRFRRDQSPIDRGER